MTRSPLALLLACVLAGCGQPPPPPADDQRRIVCLVPAMTRMLVDLGLQDQLVGVNHHDTYASDAAPALSSYPDVDIEKLLARDPTLIITAKTKDSPSPRLIDLAKRKGYQLAAFPYPESIEDVVNSIYHDHDAADAPPSLGHILDKPEQAKRLREQMWSRLTDIQQQADQYPTRSVLVCLGLSPVMASGGDTVNNDLLGYVNALNAAGGTAVKAPTFDREALLALQPEVILLMMPNAPPLREHDERLAELVELNIPAVRDQRIYLINDPHCLLPSTNLPDLAATMAHLIHDMEVTHHQGDGDG